MLINDNPKLATQPRLQPYIDLLTEWYPKVQLTSRSHGQSGICQQVADCQLVLPWLRGKQVADLGSGAGLPGIVWALLRPETHFTLFEIQRKRVSFLRYCLAQLQLQDNVRIVHGSWQEYQPQQLFTTITARGLTNMALWAKGVVSWLDKQGCCLGWYRDENLPYTLAWPPALKLTEVAYTGHTEKDKPRYVAIVENNDKEIKPCTLLQ